MIHTVHGADQIFAGIGAVIHFLAHGAGLLSSVQNSWDIIPPLYPSFYPFSKFNISPRRYPSSTDETWTFRS